MSMKQQSVHTNSTVDCQKQSSSQGKPLVVTFFINCDKNAFTCYTSKHWSITEDIRNDGSYLWLNL